ncbi:MAG: hypothetical protein NTX73_07795 [Rhodobacterales bacterium]|nr:hypothetical protein [Rhodobacterales bacterium]
MKRWTPWIIAGLSLLGLAERQVNAWNSERRLAAATATHDMHRDLTSGSCIEKDKVLAALSLRGWTMTPETPAFCTNPPGLTDWVVIQGPPPNPFGDSSSHLAFGTNGCLVTWEPVPCQ